MYTNNRILLDFILTCVSHEMKLDINILVVIVLNILVTSQTGFSCQIVPPIVILYVVCCRQNCWVLFQSIHCIGPRMKRCCSIQMLWFVRYSRYWELPVVTCTPCTDSTVLPWLSHDVWSLSWLPCRIASTSPDTNGMFCCLLCWACRLVLHCGVEFDPASIYRAQVFVPLTMLE